MLTRKEMSIIFLIISILFSTALYLKPNISDTEKPEIINKDWGIVLSITNCKKSKSSLRCKVDTNKFLFHDLDITDFPDNYLQVGDQISKQTLLYKEVAKISYVRNNMALSHSSCASWQSCFEKYNKEM